MLLTIEILNREITQRELAQKHEHLRKQEVKLELESLYKAIDVLKTYIDIEQVENRLCPCCGSDKIYITNAIHCNKCAITSEI